MMNLHGKIMNIPADPPPADDDMSHGALRRGQYLEGHRDARHAAAQLALEADKVSEDLKTGLEILEKCLAKAMKADPADVPMPLVGDEAVLWHKAQMEAYRHALEMLPQSAG